MPIAKQQNDFAKQFKNEKAKQMNDNNLADMEVELDNHPGSLERLLCTLRVRGFAINYLLVDKIPDGIQVKMQLQNMPVGSPDFKNLASHLDNQISIARVSFTTSPI